jgi:hypothetical protein
LVVRLRQHLFEHPRCRRAYLKIPSPNDPVDPCHPPLPVFGFCPSSYEAATMLNASLNESAIMTSDCGSGENWLCRVIPQIQPLLT